MTNPPFKAPEIPPTPGQFNYNQQRQQLGTEIDNAIAGSEWSVFVQRRKQLLDEMMKTLMAPSAADTAALGGQVPGTEPLAVAAGSERQAPTDEMIGQARFWKIPNPEQQSAAELRHQIDQARAEVPRQHRTKIESAMLGHGAFAAAAGAKATEMLGNALLNTEGALEHVWVVGPVLHSMLNTETAKLWLKKFQQEAAFDRERFGSYVNKEDVGKWQTVTGLGKMAGTMMPAMVAWEGLGALAGVGRLAWLTQRGTPLMRLAVKGGLTAALIEDPDASNSQKVMNIGLGAVMGAASMYGPAAGAIMGGAVGAGVGGEIGATAQERSHNQKVGAVVGFGLGALAPFAAGAFGRVAKAFPASWERGFEQPGGEPWLDQQLGGGPAAPRPRPRDPRETVDAEWEFVQDEPQVSGNPAGIPARTANPMDNLGTPVPPQQAQPQGPFQLPARTPNPLDALGTSAPTPVSSADLAATMRAADAGVPEQAPVPPISSQDYIPYNATNVMPYVRGRLGAGRQPQPPATIPPAGPFNLGPVGTPYGTGLRGSGAPVGSLYIDSGGRRQFRDIPDAELEHFISNNESLLQPGNKVGELLGLERIQGELNTLYAERAERQAGNRAPPPVAGYLQPPMNTYRVGGINYDAEATNLRRLLDEPGAAAIRGPEFEDLDKPFDKARNFYGENYARWGADTPRELLLMELEYAENKAQAQRYDTRQFATIASRHLNEVNQGPMHLRGSKVVDVNGVALKVFHGTKREFGDYDLNYDTGGNLWGRGIYHTEDTGVASSPGYTGSSASQQQHEVLKQLDESIARDKEIVAEMEARGEVPDYDRMNDLGWTKTNIATRELYRDQLMREMLYPQVRPAYLDIRRPFDIDRRYSPLDVVDLFAKLDYALEIPEKGELRKYFDLSKEALVYSQYHGEGPSGADIHEELSNVVSNYNTTISRMASSGGADQADLLRYAESRVQSAQDEIDYVMRQVNVTEEVRAERIVRLQNELTHFEEQVEQLKGSPIEKRPELYDANELLEKIGFDGVTHVGGGRSGIGEAVYHRVWIAFKPEQVHPAVGMSVMNAEQAATSAEALSKQATILASHDLPDILAKVEITDADVVQAAKTGNPGGTAIVRGVGQPMDVLRAHPDVKFVERGDKLDALVGEFSDDQVADYKKWGTYVGNTVVTKGGIEGEIQSISPTGMALVRRASGGPPLRVKVENLYPSDNGTPTLEYSDIWDRFKDFTLKQINHELNGAGMIDAEYIWDARVLPQLQHYAEMFKQSIEARTPAEAHAVDLALNKAFVEEAKTLDPEAQAMQERIGDEAVAEANDRENSRLPIAQSLEEAAEPKGFVWLSKPNADGGILIDKLNPEASHEREFDSDAAAEEFLAGFNRPAIDHTLASDVPIEVMEHIPTQYENFEPRIGYEEHADNLAEDVAMDEEDIGSLAEELANMGHPAFMRDPETGKVTYDPLAHARHVAGMEGGGGEPPEPPVDLGGGPEALGPGKRETLGGQFDRLQHEHPEKFARLMRDWTGNRLRYTRYMMARLETDLGQAGVSLGRAWKHTQELEAATAKSGNEAFDWLREFTVIMRAFPKELLRNGFVTRTHHINNQTEKFRRWWGLQTKGYSDSQIKDMIEADAKLNEFFGRFFRSPADNPRYNFDPYSEIKSWIDNARQKQAKGPDSGNPYDSQGLSPELEYFATLAQQDHIQFRVMDMRDLGHYYIRSVMWQKYQAAPHRALMNAWNDQRIPSVIRDKVTEVAGSIRYGYSPTPGLVIKSVQKTLQTVFNIPVSTRQAARLANSPFGWAYRSMLAGRPSVFFRDATQPIMALAKVRIGWLTDVYGDIFKYWKKGEGRENVLENYKLALRHGWVTREHGAIEALTPFEEAPGANMQTLAYTPKETARREAAAKTVDALLPTWLVKFDEAVNTNRLYTKEQRLNQFITGLSGYRQTKAALAEYRRMETTAALEGDPSLAMPYEKLEKDAFFGSFEPPIRQRFKELVEGGQDEEAAGLFARELTKWSQQVYTTREKPAALRTGWGRVGGFLGGFSGQFTEATVSAASNGDFWAHRVRALAVIGGFSYAMWKIGQELGMRNLQNWAWSSSLKFMSPFTEPLAQTAVAAAGLMKDQGANQLERTAIANFPSPTEIGMQFFPYRGYVQTAGAMQEAAQGPNPIADQLRYMISGDRNVQPILDDRAQASEFIRQYQSGMLKAPTPGLGRATPTPARDSIRAYNPADSSTPGITRYNQNGAPVYNSTRVGSDGRVATHRLDVPSGKLQGESWEAYENRVLSRDPRSFSPQAYRAVNSLEAVVPEVRGPMQALLAAAAQAGVPLQVAETYRPVERQEMLFQIGRSLPGKPATWTLTSDHVTGRAADLVPVGKNLDSGFRWIQENAARFGFQTLGAKDPGHIAMPEAVTHPGTGARQ